MTVVQFKPVSRPSSKLERMKDEIARDKAMETIAALVRNAGDQSQRARMAKRVVKYGAVVLCHALSLTEAAVYLQSLAGQIRAEGEGRS